MIHVEKLFPAAQERLLTLGADAHVTEAATILGDTTHHLVVVCDVGGSMIGVVTRTDIVREVSHCHGCACTMACRMIMTTQVVSCLPKDSLNQVWATMKDKALHSVPIVDEARRPLGLVSARDAFEMMLSEAEYEEAMMKEYVMCTGYR